MKPTLLSDGGSLSRMYRSKQKKGTTGRPELRAACSPMLSSMRRSRRCQKMETEDMDGGWKRDSPGVNPGRQQIKRDHKHLTDQELLVRSYERNTMGYQMFRGRHENQGGEAFGVENQAVAFSIQQRIQGARQFRVVVLEPHFLQPAASDPVGSQQGGCGITESQADGPSRNRGEEVWPRQCPGQ